MSISAHGQGAGSGYVAAPSPDPDDKENTRQKPLRWKLTHHALPDDQILVQLGAYGDYEGDQKQQYIAGLRELLADYRKRGIKDFGSISQGIINYRAQFHGDKTKILPLGTVKI